MFSDAHASSRFSALRTDDDRGAGDRVGSPPPTMHRRHDREPDGADGQHDVLPARGDGSATPTGRVGAPRDRDHEPDAAQCLTHGRRQPGSKRLAWSQYIWAYRPPAVMSSSWRPVLDDTPPLDHDDAIGASHGRETVRDHQCRGPRVRSRNRS